MKLSYIKIEPGAKTIPITSKEGYHHKKENTHYSLHIFVDLTNKRLKVNEHKISNYDQFTDYLEFICRENGLTKIIITASEEEWQELFTRGFLLEALHPTFFRGKPGFHLSKFFSQERKHSCCWDREEHVLEQARKVTGAPEKLPDVCFIRTATGKDIPQLVELFTQVFKTYPTPLNDPLYLEKAMENASVFKVLLHQNQIVSAASLDIDYRTLSAELTDCATLPSYRGQGLMSHLVQELEKEAISLGLITLYTIARSLSTGINAVFARFGFKYYGRFVNNCDICGQFQDMNLWSKQLKQ